MMVIDLITSPRREHWLQQTSRSEWGAAHFLHTLLSEGEFFDGIGNNPTVLLLAESDELTAFQTLSAKDDIQPAELGPWMGFVHTFSQYRRYRCQGKLLEEVKKRSMARGAKTLYVSASETGLHEEYGSDDDRHPWQTVERIQFACV